MTVEPLDPSPPKARTKSVAPPALATPGIAAFGALVSPDAPTTRAVQDLYALLSKMPGPERTHVERVDWIAELGDWMRAHLLPVGADAERTRRLGLLVRALGEVDVFRNRFAALLSGILGELKGTRLFADVGIPVEPGFWREAVERISRRILPTPPQPYSFFDLLSRLFQSDEEARWLESSPRELWGELWDLLEETSSPISTAWIPLTASMADAIRILAARVAALGVAQDIRDRLPEIPISDLPFLRLPRICDTLQLPGGPKRDSATNEEAIGTIAECRQALRQVHSHVEEFGVSVDLVYRLELISEQLSRLEKLIHLLSPQTDGPLASTVGRFALDLVQAQFQGRSVVGLLRTNAHLLARKIVERTGKTGEHYITETRAEWRKMLFSAAGGGFLTAFTAALKFLLNAIPFPAFFAGLFASLNYAGSFLLMGALHYTLATKQPSMTAAALAASLESEEGKLPNPDRLVTLIAQIARSQLAAAMGNLGMVVPTALAMAFVWQTILGSPFLSPEKAKYVVTSLSPFHSGVVWYAAITGVLLWISSIAAGWLENWITYRQLPEALAQHHRLKKVLGAERAAKLGAALGNQAASVGGSVSLGVLLGVVPMMGVFFGLPINVAHVTLSTGSLAFAGASLGLENALRAEFLFAVSGIGLIGLMNFGVSFVFALAVALRARDAFRTDYGAILKNLAKALWSRVYHHPLEFMFPPSPKAAAKRAREAEELAANPVAAEPAAPQPSRSSKSEIHARAQARDGHGAKDGPASKSGKHPSLDAAAARDSRAALDKIAMPLGGDDPPTLKPKRRAGPPSQRKRVSK